MPLLDGKVALVTGGGSGIGQAACHFYAREGAKVVVSDINQEGNQTVQTIREMNGDSIFVQADVSKPEDCQTLIKTTLEEYGRLDIAFNNAGIGGEANLIADYSVEGWQKVMGPAFLRTSLITGLEQNEQIRDQMISLYPMGRLGESEEVAELVIRLSSEKASFVTGAYDPIDGGYSTRQLEDAILLCSWLHAVQHRFLLLG